jgi:hypothetical protein
VAKTTTAVSERRRETLRVLLAQGKSKVEAIAVLLNVDKSLIGVLKDRRVEQITSLWHIDNVRAANAKAERPLRPVSNALQLALASKEDFDQMRSAVDVLTDEQIPKEVREETVNFLSRFERALEKRTSRARGRTRKTEWHQAIKKTVDLAVVEWEVTEAVAYGLVSAALFKIREGIAAESVRDIHKEIAPEKID